MSERQFFIEKVKKDFGIRIVSLFGADWRRKFFNCLLPPFVELRSGDKYGGQASMENLLDLAKEKLKAETAVIEPYISTDWNSEYSAIYSRTFPNIRMVCQRIHFFGKDIGEGDLYDISKELEDAYLGYTVVRPLQAFRVGDTVLKSPCSIATKDGIELVHCQEKYDVSLLGHCLEVRGMPFIQQDTTVAVCAEADLWMVARYLNKRGEIGRYRPAEITRLANATITTGPGREGLFELQMMDALRQMGLNPVTLYPTDASEAKAFIYTCIESELPIITGIPGHVFVVIGHDYYQEHMRFGVGLKSISDMVNAFIVHDDARGPYLKMNVGKRSLKVDRKMRELLTLEKEPVDFFIVAFPPRVHMYWRDAWNSTTLWIEKINNYAKRILGIKGVDIWAPRELKGLVTRTCLRSSRDFKCDISHRKPTPLKNDKIITKYRCMKMPKYIWVTELSYPSDLKGGSTLNRKIRGEIVLDSTSNRHVPEENLLAFHLNGKMFVPKEGDSELIVADDVPYSPLIRSRCQNPVGAVATTGTRKVN